MAMVVVRALSQGKVSAAPSIRSVVAHRVTAEPEREVAWYCLAMNARALLIAQPVLLTRPRAIRVNATARFARLLS